MVETTVIGIDCATNEAKVGPALASASNGRCVIKSAGLCPSGKGLAELLIEWLSASPRTLLAIDAPLGWPEPLGKALAQHSAGAPLFGAANDLFRRTTDQWIKRSLGKQSLDVGADRIARTAHAALHLLRVLREHTGEEIPLAWEPLFVARVAAIEVYPAATLISMGIPIVRYKKSEEIALRKQMMVELERVAEFPMDGADMERNPDAFDAAVCAIAGSDFLRGIAEGPQDQELAQREGWIWVRSKGRG